MSTVYQLLFFIVAYHRSFYAYTPELFDWHLCRVCARFLKKIEFGEINS